MWRQISKKSHSSDYRLAMKKRENDARYTEKGDPKCWNKGWDNCRYVARAPSLKKTRIDHLEATVQYNHVKKLNKFPTHSVQMFDSKKKSLGHLTTDIVTLLASDYI